MGPIVYQSLEAMQTIAHSVQDSARKVQALGQSSQRVEQISASSSSRQIPR